MEEKIVVRCRKCGKTGETVPPTLPEEAAVSPVIIYCDKCEDFTLADVVR